MSILFIRNVEEDARERFHTGAMIRGLTHGAFLNLLMKFLATARCRGNAGARSNIISDMLADCGLAEVSESDSKGASSDNYQE
jgi:hypothetical protein